MEDDAPVKFWVGLDLGQAQDYTALSVLQATREAVDRWRYEVRHLERLKLGTSYPAIVEYVAGLVNRRELRAGYELVADATGVGRPVIDLLRAADLSLAAVTITGGTTVNNDGWSWHVPKRDLVHCLLVLMQEKRLRFAEGLPEVPTLIKELLSFQVKITEAAHDTYGAWREGTHDDIVLSVALAAWRAERCAAGTAVVAKNPFYDGDLPDEAQTGKDAWGWNTTPHPSGVDFRNCRHRKRGCHACAAELYTLSEKADSQK